MTSPSPVQLVDYYRPGGFFTALNVTSVGVIKPSGGVLMRIIPLAVGSSGTLTVNDSSATGGATVANEIFSVPFNGMNAGLPIELKIATSNGITVSAIPPGSQFVITYN